MSEAARDIYQAHLDIVGRALFAHDFDTVCAMMSYPSRMETVDAEIVLETPEDYIPSLEAFYDNIKALGAREYHRICRRAEFTSPAQDRIKGVHATYILSGAAPLLPPYENHMTLVLQDGRWLGAGIRAGVSNTKGNIIRRARV